MMPVRQMKEKVTVPVTGIGDDRVIQVVREDWRLHPMYQRWET